MKRRELLAGVSFATTGCAGCLSSFNNEGENNSEGKRNIEYERCGYSVVSIHSLPTPAKDEVEAAIGGNVYESDRDLVLSEVMNTDEAYLSESASTGGYIYYEPKVDSNNDTTRLRVKEIHPKRASLPGVKNKMETNITVDIRIEYEKDLVLKDSLDLAAGESIDLDNGTDYHWGKYHATLTIHTGTEVREEEVTWIHDHIRGAAYIFISFDDPGGVFADGPSKAREFCEWNDSGELVSGSGQ